MAQLARVILEHQSQLTALHAAAFAERLTSTMIFAGVSGTGKRMVARALSQSLICERGENYACGDCGSCLRVANCQSESVLEIVPETSQIKIEQAREIQRFLCLRTLGRARTVIIDQAHLLSAQAANALLKTFEEPPPNTYFFLITPLPASLSATIRSRAQLVHFRPLSEASLQKVLGGNGDPWLLTAARGSAETALSLEQSRAELGEAEHALEAYLRRAVVAFPGAEVVTLREQLKEKSAQSFIVRLLQEVLCDAIREKTGVVTARWVRWPEIAAEFSSFALRDLEELAERSLALEFDLARNVDRGLIFENFAFSIAKAKAGRLREEMYA